jgi:hypothetical protein
MKLLFLFLSTFLLGFSSMEQVNPWLQSNSAENPWRQSSSNENPWGTNTSNDTILGPEVQNVLTDVQKRNPVQFGFDAYIAPGGVVAPAIIGAIPALGIITIPLMPLFTAAPLFKKEEQLKKKYLKKYPDANPQELNGVRKGMNRKRWRNTGVGMGIGLLGQIVALAIIFN